MGIFNWFSKPKTFEKCDDAIWMSRKAKWMGIVTEIADQSAAGNRVLLVAHFPDTTAQACEILQRMDVAFVEEKQRWDSGDIARFTQHKDRLPFVILAESLPDTPGRQQPHLVDEREPAFSVLVLERHLLSSEDERVARFAESLPGRSRLQFFQSLEDPLMQVFAGDSVRKTLERLGVSQDERIENPMLSRWVQAAQQKAQKQALGNAKAESAESWMASNMPP